MSLFNGLSAGLTALTQGVAANNEGKEAGNTLLRQIYEKRQDEELKAAQTANTWRQANQLQLGDPRYTAAKGAEAGAIEGGKTPAIVDRTKQLQPITTAGKVADQKALLPGEVEKTGKIEAVKQPYEMAKIDRTSSNTLSREKQLIPLKEAAASRASDAKPTDSERGSAAWAGTLAQASSILDHIGKPEVTASLLKKYGTWGNFLISPEGQAFNQAADQYVNAAQMATEGVRFSPEKEKAMRQMSIPNGATDQSVVQQMSNARKMIARTAAIKAGRAKHEVHPDVRKALGWDDGQSGLEPIAANVGTQAPAANAGHPVLNKYGITPTAPE